MASAITAENLEVRYAGDVALADVHLTVPAGTSLAIIGPNGSGKSTLLAALAGTVKPSAGRTHVAGTAPALVLQATDVDKSLPITVRDTVSLARYPTLGLFRRFRPADREVVARSLRRMEVEDLAHRQLRELSGGQRQRVLVAQGLAQESDVLLLDEPVNGLDLASRALILDVIDAELASGRTVVITTHSLEDARRFQQVVLLKTSPIAVGPPSEVLTDDYLRQGFGGHFLRVGDRVILDDPHHSH